MTVRAGRLRHRVTIQRFTETQDEYGHVQKTWEDINTYWADVRALVGREGDRARQVRADITHRVTMRNVGVDLSPETHRLVWDGRILGIIEALEDRVKASWQITCIEGDV